MNLSIERGKEMTEKCYSLNGEDFFDDWCQLVDNLEQEGLGEGAEYFEADKVDVVIKDYVNLHSIISILEDFDDQLYQDVGEVSDCDFSRVTQDAKQELQELIQTWSEKYVNLPYWKVENVVKNVMTKGDLE